MAHHLPVTMTSPSKSQDFENMTKAQLKMLYSKLKRDGVKASTLYEIEKLMQERK